MAAKTSQNDNTHKAGVVVRLFALVSSALTLIQGGKRGSEMVQALIFALQLFKENRLGEVKTVSLSPVKWEVRESSEKVTFQGAPREVNETGSRFDLLSTPLAKSGLDKKAISKLKVMGVRLVGEIHLIKTDFNLRKTKWWKGVESFLEKNDIHGIDPLVAGWCPPYWHDPDFLEALNAPIPARWYHSDFLWFGLNIDGIHCFGDLIRAIVGLNISALRTYGSYSSHIALIAKSGVFGQLTALCGVDLNMRMHVPADWSASVDVCPEWKRVLEAQPQRRKDLEDKIKRELLTGQDWGVLQCLSSVYQLSSHGSNRRPSQSNWLVSMFRREHWRDTSGYYLIFSTGRDSFRHGTKPCLLTKLGLEKYKGMEPEEFVDEYELPSHLVCM